MLWQLHKQIITSQLFWERCNLPIRKKKIWNYVLSKPLNIISIFLEFTTARHNDVMKIIETKQISPEGNRLDTRHISRELEKMERRGDWGHFCHLTASITMCCWCLFTESFYMSEENRGIGHPIMSQCKSFDISDLSCVVIKAVRS